MAWEVCAALVDHTGSITVSMVLLCVKCVVPDGTGGLVVVPDTLATFEAAAFRLGGGRVISGSCFLFLNCIHNTNQQYQWFKLQQEIYKQKHKRSHWASQLFTLIFGKQLLV